MAKSKTQTWRERKAKIILRYGSIAQCTRELGVSDEAIRLTIKGKCPGVAKKLEAAGV